MTVLYAVCAIVAAACAVIAVGYLSWIVFNPQARERRQALQMARDLDRAARRPHRHDFERWSEPHETRVYESGTLAGTTKERLPIRRDYHQERTCRTCGLHERREVFG